MVAHWSLRELAKGHEMSELRDRSKQWDKQYVGAGTGHELSYDFQLNDEEYQNLTDALNDMTYPRAIEEMFPELANRTWWLGSSHRTITWQETIKE